MIRFLSQSGDDYVVKPFALSELLARTNVLARRPALQRTPPSSRSPTWTWMCSNGPPNVRNSSLNCNYQKAPGGPVLQSGEDVHSNVVNMGKHLTLFCEFLIF